MLNMVLFSVVSILLAAIPTLAQDLSAAHNLTGLAGTWSSGSRNVLTGSGFANPSNKSFTYPKTAGVSYSFTDTGFYEVARYRFSGNGSDPHCITGIMNWHHGSYQLLPNNSMVLTPLGDGYQQIQDPCAAVSNFIEDYNDTELYQSWQIFQDPVDGYKLHMFQFDGSPVAPQFQVSVTPNMLPTQLLRNVTNNTLTQQQVLLAASTNGGESSWRSVGAGSLMTAIVSLGVASLLL